MNRIDIDKEEILKTSKWVRFLFMVVYSTLPMGISFPCIPNKGFDGRGNYTLGIKEQIAFPEISIDKVLKVTGMDITSVSYTHLTLPTKA